MSEPFVVEVWGEPAGIVEQASAEPRAMAGVVRNRIGRIGHGSGNNRLVGLTQRS